MEVIRDSDRLISRLKELKIQQNSLTVGFVATMGALHRGHIALVNKALGDCDFVVTSIFVNPTQFNRQEDLDKYPRNEQQDLHMLEESGTHIAFLPGVEDIYPDSEIDYEIDLDNLDTIIEGKYRPGHFKGVAMVLDRFFQIIQPDKAYFGQKDIQQIAVVRKMTQEKGFDVDVVEVPTVRTEHGLAFSSRNKRLTVEELDESLIIFETMKKGVRLADSVPDAETLREELIKYFKKGSSTLELEYLEIVDKNTFRRTDDKENWHICIAVYCNGVRLIDNMSLSS